MLFRSLYRLQQEVERLEKALADAPIDRHERLLAQLRAARADRDRLRRMLAGQKDAPSSARR